MNLSELYEALENKILEQKQKLEQKFQDWMRNHLEQDNPHQITPDKIGAAKSSITVQGKPLTENVLLTAGDVAALPEEGVAVAAKKLETPRLIRLSGLLHGEVAFDGGANVQLAASEAVAPIRYEYPDEFSVKTYFDDPLHPSSMLVVFNADGLVTSCIRYEPKRDVSYSYEYDSEGRLLKVTPSIIRDELPHYEIGTTPVLTQEVVTKLVDHLDATKQPDPHTQYQLKP